MFFLSLLGLWLTSAQNNSYAEGIHFRVAYLAPLQRSIVSWLFELGDSDFSLRQQTCIKCLLCTQLGFEIKYDRYKCCVQWKKMDMEIRKYTTVRQLPPEVCIKYCTIGTDMVVLIYSIPSIYNLSSIAEALM